MRTSILIMALLLVSIPMLYVTDISMGAPTLQIQSPPSSGDWIVTGEEEIVGEFRRIRDEIQERMGAFLTSL